MLESLLSKVAEYCEIFKKIYSEEHLRTAASMAAAVSKKSKNNTF